MVSKGPSPSQGSFLFIELADLNQSVRAGDEISGTIHLNLETDILPNVKQLLIGLHGDEKILFGRLLNKDAIKFKFAEEKRKSEIIKIEFPIWTPPPDQEQLSAPLQRLIPFIMKLPDWLPPSFEYYKT